MTLSAWHRQWPRAFPRPDAGTMRHNLQMTGPFCRAHARRRLDTITPLEAAEWSASHPAQVRYLRTLFADAARAGLVGENPFLGCRLPRSGPRSRVAPLPMGEAVALAERAPVEFRAFVLCALGTGLRLSELAAVQASHVSVVPPRIFVPSGKGGKSRTVAVLGVAEQALPRAAQVGRVFSRADGSAWDRNSVGRAWRALRGDHLRGFHSLRATHATWLLDRGASPLDVAVQLGHFDVDGRPNASLVERVYGRPDPGLALGRLEAL